MKNVFYILSMFLGLSLLSMDGYAQQLEPVEVSRGSISPKVLELVLMPHGGRGGGNPGEGGSNLVLIELDGFLINVEDLINSPPEELDGNLALLFDLYLHANVIKAVTTFESQMQTYSRTSMDLFLARMIQNLVHYKVIKIQNNSN